MKKLTDPKILIPLVIVLIALGAFAATTMTGGNTTPTNYGQSQGDHGHEH